MWSAFLPLERQHQGARQPGGACRRRALCRQSRQPAVLHRQRRPRSAVSGRARRRRHVEAFKQLGVSLVFRPQATAGHDTSWWPYERCAVRAVREAEAARGAPGARVVGNRAHRQVQSRRLVDRRRTWRRAAADASFPNQDIFEHRRQSGRIDIERAGNAFTAKSRGVRAFTLLLSPDAIDFAQPVTVIGERRRGVSRARHEGRRGADEVGGPRCRPSTALRRGAEGAGAVVRLLAWIALAILVSADLSARLKPGPTTRVSSGTATDAFDEAWRRLKTGPAYGPEKTGAFQMRYPFKSGVEFENWVDVPAEYDPEPPLAASRPAARRRRPAGAECGAARTAETQRAADRIGSPASRRSTSIPAAGPTPSGGTPSRSTTSCACLRDIKAPLQRRRIAHLSDRHFGRRHRRLLPGDARTDAVVRGAPVQRQHRRPAQPLDWRRRALRQQSGQQAALHRQRRAGSALSRATAWSRTCGGSSCLASHIRSGRKRAPGTIPRGGRPNASRTSDSCGTIRACRIPRSCRGKPSGPIDSIACTGWSSIALATAPRTRPSRTRAFSCTGRHPVAPTSSGSATHSMRRTRGVRALSVAAVTRRRRLRPTDRGAGQRQGAVSRAGAKRT